MIKKAKLRALLLGTIVTMIFVGLAGRLYWVQVVEASWLMKKAENSWQRDAILQPKRGAILDRNGNVLAEDASSYTVTVNPSLIHKYDIADEVVDGLAPILKMTSPEKKEKLRKLATARKDNGEYYSGREIRNEGWKIDEDTAKKIEKMTKDNKLSGIYLIEEPKRYYPNNELAAHVLGYLNKEGEPIMGLEYYYDKLLRGKPGSVSYEKDGLGNELPDSDVKYQPAENGKNLRLTIDMNIQHYMEQSMQKIYDQFKPKSLTAVAVDPKTMEVLGMANLPTFNPNQYWNFNTQGDFTNHAVASLYEPGSTFKIVTLAGAVEQGIFHPDKTYMSGSIAVKGRSIHDHNWSGWGSISYLDGLKRSSNVAFVKLGYEGLGEEKLRKYIDLFGFGHKTGIDMPGEAAGSIDFHYPIEVATATFGQGKVQVTALQEAAAVSSVANGGMLMQPHIVKEIDEPDTGKPVQTIGPKEIHRVIPESVAHQTSLYLEQVVADQEIGTGRRAYIPGYRVAGKTGTSQAVVNGTYSDEQYIISFVAYAPVDDPKILIVVIADQPDIGGNYENGGEVAAPIVKEVLTKSLRYMGVSVSSKKSQGIPLETDKEQIAAPEVKGLTVTAANNELKERGLTGEMLGKGQTIIAQYPQTGTEIGKEQRMYLLTEAAEKIPLPDLTGQSLRDALEICSLLGYTCTTTGQGFVTSQTVVTGSKKSVALKLSPTAVNEAVTQTSTDSGTDDDSSANQSAKNAG